MTAMSARRGQDSTAATVTATLVAVVGGVALGRSGLGSGSEGWLAAIGLVVVVGLSALWAMLSRPDRRLGSLSTKAELVAAAAAAAAATAPHPQGPVALRSVAMLRRSAVFSERTVAEVLTPRTSMVSLGADATGADLAELSQRTGLSRVIVTGGDLDDIVGQVHIKNLLAVAEPQRAAALLGDLAVEVMMVPASLRLVELLREMRVAASPIAVVLDEYGGTAGLVTVEDVVEELVGEIDDEHDRAGARRHPVQFGGTSVLPGGLNLAEVEELVGLCLPHGRYETLGGFVMERVGAVPEVGDRFEFAGYRFEVLDMLRRRVMSVRVIEPEGQR